MSVSPIASGMNDPRAGSGPSRVSPADFAVRAVPLTRYAPWCAGLPATSIVSEYVSSTLNFWSWNPSLLGHAHVARPADDRLVGG